MCLSYQSLCKISTIIDWHYLSILSQNPKISCLDHVQCTKHISHKIRIVFLKYLPSHKILGLSLLTLNVQHLCLMFWKIFCYRAVKSYVGTLFLLPHSTHSSDGTTWFHQRCICDKQCVPFWTSALFIVICTSKEHAELKSEDAESYGSLDTVSCCCGITGLHLFLGNHIFLTDFLSLMEINHCWPHQPQNIIIIVFTTCDWFLNLFGCGEFVCFHRMLCFFFLFLYVV